MERKRTRKRTVKLGEQRMERKEDKEKDGKG
jgi:hypothetical protein